jgi:hypothetical protein
MTLLNDLPYHHEGERMSRTRAINLPRAGMCVCVCRHTEERRGEEERLRERIKVGH